MMQTIVARISNVPLRCWNTSSIKLGQVQCQCCYASLLNAGVWNLEIWVKSKYVQKGNCMNTQLGPWKMFAQVYEFIWILPGTQMTLVFVGKGLVFLGLTFRNRGHWGSRYVYSHPIVSMFHDFEGFVWCMCQCQGKENAFPGSNAVNVTVERCEWLSVRAKTQLCPDWSVDSPWPDVHQWAWCMLKFNVNCSAAVSVLFPVFSTQWFDVSSIFEGVRMCSSPTTRHLFTMFPPVAITSEVINTRCGFHQLWKSGFWQVSTFNISLTRDFTPPRHTST